jgi:hypothetical protein
METIVNKVAESGLITLDLEEYYPSGDVKVFDLKDYLFMGLILKEKDYRESLKNLDTEQYRDKIVNITCTADAVIPMWAYMLATTYLQPVAKAVSFGSEKQVLDQLYIKNLSKIQPQDFADKRIVVKGCGDKAISEVAYVEITRMLVPVAKSIMYGEPCSTVPLFKRK